MTALPKNVSCLADSKETKWTISNLFNQFSTIQGTLHLHTLFIAKGNIFKLHPVDLDNNHWLFVDIDDSAV